MQYHLIMVCKNVFAGSRTQYQEQFPEFAGQGYSQMVATWNRLYGANKITTLNSPVGNARVSSQFLAERECNPCSQTHGGTDYAIPVGTPVNATANGIVARSYSSGSYGNTVVVDHGASSLGDGTNVFTLYAHGSSRLVENGATVTVGQPIPVFR